MMLASTMTLLGSAETAATRVPEGSIWKFFFNCEVQWWVLLLAWLRHSKRRAEG
jgi:hypothetical protein